MDDKRWDKLAAGTGVAFVALILASSFVVPKTPPKIDDPIGKIGRFFVDHHNGLLWGGWLGMLATLFGLWFVGTVAHWVRRQDQPRLATIAFGGGVTAFGVALLATLFSTTIAYSVGTEAFGRGIVRALYTMGDMGFTFLWIPIAVFVAATSMAGMRSKAMPQWLWGSGAVFSVAALVASAGVFSHGGFFAPAGTYAFIAFLVFAAWALALSLWLMQHVGESSMGAPSMGAERPMATTG